MTKEHCSHILLPAMDDPIYPRSKLPAPKLLDKPPYLYNNLPTSSLHSLKSEGISWLHPKFLESVTPIFTTRLVPSITRARLKMGEKTMHVDLVRLAMDFKPVRISVDMYTTDSGDRPIVVDGDDLVHEPEEVCSKICIRLGLDPGLMK